MEKAVKIGGKVTIESLSDIHWDEFETAEHVCRETFSKSGNDGRSFKKTKKFKDRNSFRICRCPPFSLEIFFAGTPPSYMTQPFWENALKLIRQNIGSLGPWRRDISTFILMSFSVRSSNRVVTCGRCCCYWSSWSFVYRQFWFVASALFHFS